MEPHFRVRVNCDMVTITVQVWRPLEFRTALPSFSVSRSFTLVTSTPASVLRETLSISVERCLYVVELNPSALGNRGGEGISYPPFRNFQENRSIRVVLQPGQGLIALGKHAHREALVPVHVFQELRMFVQGPIKNRDFNVRREA